MPEPFFAYTIQQTDASGRTTPPLLSVCPSLAAVCSYLQRWNMKPHQSYVCGWERAGRQMVIPTEVLVKAMEEERALPPP